MPHSNDLVSRTCATVCGLGGDFVSPGRRGWGPKQEPARGRDPVGTELRLASAADHQKRNSRGVPEQSQVPTTHYCHPPSSAHGNNGQVTVLAWEPSLSATGSCP